MGWLARHRLKKSIDLILDAKRYVSKNKYDLAFVCLLDCQKRLEKIKRYYAVQDILTLVLKLRSIVNSKNYNFDRQSPKEIRRNFNNLASEILNKLEKLLTAAVHSGELSYA